MQDPRNYDPYSPPPESGGYGYPGMLAPYVPPRRGLTIPGILAVLAIGALLGAVLVVAVTSRPPRSSAAPFSVAPTPTATVIDRGGTVRQLQALARLETYSVTAERVVEASRVPDSMLGALAGDRLLMIVSADVVVGIDLSRLRPEDVVVSEAGDSVTVHLPPTEIFDVSPNTEQTRVYSRDRGWFAPQNSDLESEARASGETLVLQAACDLGVMERAREQAVHAIEALLTSLEFAQITVQGRAGACALGPTAATPSPPAAAP